MTITIEPGIMAFVLACIVIVVIVLGGWALDRLFSLIVAQQRSITELGECVDKLCCVIADEETSSEPDSRAGEGGSATAHPGAAVDRQFGQEVICSAFEMKVKA